MCTVRIGTEIYNCPEGTLLSELLTSLGTVHFHPCGGRGICKKCTVTVNGQPQLSCRYIINEDITVETSPQENIVSEHGEEIKECEGENSCLVLDLGTTTLTLALVEEKTGSVKGLLTRPNRQGALGADVLSRTAASKKHGAGLLQSILVKQLNEMTEKLGITAPIKLYAAGNTIMLHTLFGEDCSTLGTAPYTPVFLEARICDGADVGLSHISKVYSLPCISAFAGADVTAGLNALPPPEKGKYSILADLGTNAEIALFSTEEIIVTSAAAGPCFEGVGIECGMSASRGAIYSYESASRLQCVEGAPPEGICSTGLIDVIAVLVRNSIIDSDGFMECPRFRISDKVYITREDVRQFQNAKSAVISGIMTLIRNSGLSYDDIDKLYISGGFAAKMNTDNAVTAGIIPKELKNRCVPLKNTCLSGTIRFIREKSDLSALVSRARYSDLSEDKTFSELFIKNMSFPREENS